MYNYNPYSNPYLNNNILPNSNNLYNSTQPPQTPQTNLDWIKVQSIQQVKDAQNQSNTTTWYMHNGGEWIACKAVDSMGIPTIKAWNVTEISTDNQQPNTDIYATKNELSEIKGEINKLKDTLNAQNYAKKED